MLGSRIENFDIVMYLIQPTVLKNMFHGSTCRATFGTQVGCTWRAPEVGHWDDFADLDGDGELDGGPLEMRTVAHPTSTMLSPSPKWSIPAILVGHAGDRHLTVLAVEV